MASTRKRTGNKRAAARDVPPLNEEPSGELKFDLRVHSDRIGEPRSRKKVEKEFPRKREAEAGRRQGTMPPGSEQTADEGSQEIALDEDPSHTPSLRERRDPADSVLSVVGSAGVGAGGGLDEAEEAQVDPIDPEEHKRLKRRVARSGGGMANFEPSEAGAGNPGRERNRPRAGRATTARKAAPGGRNPGSKPRGGARSGRRT